MGTKLCKKCGSPELAKGRRICKYCNRERSKKYYSNEKRKAKLNSFCAACKELFHAWREKQILCGSCYKDSVNTGFEPNKYVFNPKKSDHVHRKMAEDLIGRKLSKNEVVHHVDENPKNNSLDNLWVMSRYHHGRLHAFLRLQRVVYEKSLDKHSVNCWDTLRVHQTTAWLATSGAKVLKLVELGNQQPSDQSNLVEGSETKHGTP